MSSLLKGTERIGAQLVTQDCDGFGWRGSHQVVHNLGFNVPLGLMVEFGDGCQFPRTGSSSPSKKPLFLKRAVLLCPPWLRVQPAAFCSPGPRLGILVLHGHERVAANQPTALFETHPFNSIVRQSQVSSQKPRAAAHSVDALLSVGQMLCLIDEM